MIAYLKGTVLEKNTSSVTIEVGAIGYEVHISTTSLRRIGDAGAPLELFICESVGLYGGGVSLYGFLTREEKELFLCLREHVPSTGAKKALEHLDKASRSLPEFRRAILEGDARILAGVFGFTHKTAERLIAALKDKLPTLGSAIASDKAFSDSVSQPAGLRTRPLQQALDALITLGYRPSESRQVLVTLASEFQNKESTVEEMIRLALKRL